MTDPETVCLRHEGSELIGRIARPIGNGPHPAVLVMHNAHGINPYMIEVAERLARLGYVAVATDMYGEAAYRADAQEAGLLLAPMWRDPALMRRRAVAWFDHLEKLEDVDADRRGAIGYCFGGQCVLEIARSGADARAIVSYHAVLKTHAPALPGVVRAHVAIHTGTDDPWAPAADVAAARQELVAGGGRWQIAEYGGVAHGFAEPHPIARQGISYDAVADRTSWAATVALLAEVM